jgi:hypothetical protein
LGSLIRHLAENLRLKQFVGAESEGYATPGFLSKSAEAIENKRVESFASARKCKKCKRVRKNLKRQGIMGSESSVEGNEERNAPPSPHYMHEYQKKRLTEIAIRN